MKRIGFGYWRAIAALGRAVELGDDEAGQRDRLVEGLDLSQRVLPDVGVEHQQHLVRRRRVGLLDHPADLGDLLHQVQLRRQAARGVGDHDVDAARLRGGNRVEDDGRRIARFLGDDGHVVALAPGHQLLACRGAEGVAGGEEDALAVLLEVLGQLADRGRLAGAVHAGDHDHEGLVGFHLEQQFERLEEVVQDVGQRLLDRLRRFQLVLAGTRL
jgi:hypothetical protein